MLRIRIDRCRIRYLQRIERPLYICECVCSCRCRCVSRVENLVQLSANLLVLRRIRGISFAHFHLFRRRRRRGTWFDCVGVISYCSGRCCFASRVESLAQLLANLLALRRTRGISFAHFRLFRRHLRRGNCARAIFPLLLRVLWYLRAWARPTGRSTRCDSRLVLLANPIKFIIPCLSSIDIHAQECLERLSMTDSDRQR